MNEHHTTLDEGQECLVGDPALLESILDEGTRQWYFWQPGVLQMSPIPAAPGYLGGLTQDAARLVLVRQEAYHRRRRFLLSAMTVLSSCRCRGFSGGLSGEPPRHFHRTTLSDLERFSVHDIIVVLILAWHASTVARQVLRIAAARECNPVPSHGDEP